MLLKSKYIDKYMIPGYNSFHESSYINTSSDESISKD